MATITDDTQAETATDTESDLMEMAGVANELTDVVETVAPEDGESASDDELINALEALKAAEKAAEEARKGIVKDALKDRVETGEAIEATDKEAKLVEGHNKYLTDEEAALATLASAGVSRQMVMDVKASEVANVAADADVDVSPYIGRATYDYFRVNDLE